MIYKKNLIKLNSQIMYKGFWNRSKDLSHAEENVVNPSAKNRGWLRTVVKPVTKPCQKYCKKLHKSMLLNSISSFYSISIANIKLLLCS